MTISETEFALDPADPSVAAGEVTITATNDGATVHNLEVEGDGVEEITDDLDPGQSGELKLDLAGRRVRDLLRDRRSRRAGHGRAR